MVLAAFSVLINGWLSCANGLARPGGRRAVGSPYHVLGRPAREVLDLSLAEDLDQLEEARRVELEDQQTVDRQHAEHIAPGAVVGRELKKDRRIAEEVERVGVRDRRRRTDAGKCLVARVDDVELEDAGRNLERLRTGAPFECERRREDGSVLSRGDAIRRPCLERPIESDLTHRATSPASAWSTARCRSDPRSDQPAASRRRAGSACARRFSGPAPGRRPDGWGSAVRGHSGSASAFTFFRTKDSGTGSAAPWRRAKERRRSSLEPSRYRDRGSTWWGGRPPGAPVRGSRASARTLRRDRAPEDCRSAWAASRPWGATTAAASRRSRGRSGALADAARHPATCRTTRSGAGTGRGPRKSRRRCDCRTSR